MMRISNHSAFVAFLATLFFFAGIFPAMSETPEETPLPTLRLMADETPAKSGEADGISGATVTGDDNAQGETSPDAVSGATPKGGQKLQPNFLGLKVSVQAHKATGYIAGGLFAAAGVVGTYRFLDMMKRGHEYRDETDAVSSASTQSHDELVTKAWESGQALRWTHVGLVAAGESLYLFDAVTGISMIPKDGKSSLAGTIHRDAFFVHVGLMAAEVVLGFLETNALEKGNHDAVVAYGAAHAGIGFAIPLVIIGSGLAIDFYPDLK